MVTWVSLLLCCSQAAADLLVRTVTVNNVNYDDFSLLCAEGIPLLMEDHKPRPCQPRPWKAEQRCPVGFWCHEGDDESSYYCCPRSRKVSNHCHLPPATGFGKQLMRRFYYDWKTDGCHELHYTGIGGNENSYMTYESCEGACRGTGEPTPKVFGGLSSGSSNKEDKKNPEKDKNSKIKNKGPTISFTISSTEIPQVIPSSESVEIPSYSALTSTMKKVTEPATTYIQSTFSSSPPTTYTNEASTLTEIVANPCILPPERGSSGGIARKMWYFDMSTLSCVQFTYQGSGGNSNKFERSPTCMAVCGIGKPTRKSCDLPASVGEGPFKIPRFFFDSKTQRCELFYYSGENGNDNRFFKKHKCERLCLGKASKKKEQTRIPEQVTYAPTRKNVNFVPNETQPPTESFERGRTATTPKTKQIEIERPNHITRKPAQPQTEHTHYERFETKRPPLVVEMLPETTGTKTTSTTPLFYTAPPTTPSYPSNFFIQTETVRPFEPQTFPTLVYVPKEEDSDSTTAPFAPYPQATVRTEKPMDELFNHLMTVKPQQPMIQGQRTGDRGYSTGAPTIVEKSQIGPAPDTHVPLGNFPWATTPPGYTMPTGINPPVYVGTNEQLEAMVMAMGVHPPPSHQVHVGPPQQQVIPPPPEMNVQPPNYPTYQGIKSAVPPPGSLLSMPALQRQWGTSSPHNPAVQVPSQHIDSQPSFQLGLASLPNVAVPVSSSGNQVASEDRRGNFQPSQSPAAPFVPTPQQLPGTLPPAFIPQSPVGSFQPHPGAVIGQQGVRAYVNHIATQTFGVNLIHEPIGSFQPNPNNSSKVEVVTHHPDYNLPNINVSIVNDLNSPCQLPVTNPDVIIMCEQEDVYCLVGSFCQVGLGQSICCPSLGISPCLQPLQRGVGVAQIPRWFFNPHTKRCEVFSFGGFQGNENNFLTYSDCQNTCDAMNPCERGQPVPATNPDQQCSVNNRCPAESMCHAVGLTSYCCNVRKPVTSPQKPKLDNDPCRQQILEGTGTASDHRWAFDQNLGRCVSFIYQGENGNLNNFLTKSDCQAICGAPPTVPSRCLQPGMSGDGDDYLARYFYSPEYRQCLHFIYSGKGGTENNFESQQDCIETCIANGVKFSSLASTVPQPTFSFSFMPSPICPQGAALLDSNNEPMSCNVSECPNGYVCTTLGPQQFCCPAPESFCLEPRPAVSVCEKGGTPAVQIRFTYDPLSDKCVRFSYENCNPNVASLNSFATQPQCSRLCCNQGFNLLYRRKVRMLLNDDPMIKRSRRI